MANFFTDEVFTCSCGSMLFEKKETKSFKMIGKTLVENTKVEYIKCCTCGKEHIVNDDGEVVEQA